MRGFRQAVAGAILLAAAVSASADDRRATITVTQPPAAKKAQLGDHGFDLTSLDPTVKACDDFYRYTTAGWQAKNPVPAAYSRWGSFDVLQERNRDILHDIVEADAKSTAAKKGSNAQKIGDFYASCMAEDAIEAQGLKAIQPELAKIDAIGDTASLQAAIARVQILGGNAVFRFGSQQDFKDSTAVIASAAQGGLGLPDRDYYTNDDQKSKDIRDAYVKHVAKMFELAGDSPEKAQTRATAVLALETKLAQASMTRVQRRDPNAIYHRLPLAEVKALTPDFSWDAFLKAVDAPKIDSMNVQSLDFMKAMNAQLKETSLDDWRSYLRWKILDASAAAMPKAFVEEDFEFNGKVLRGTREILPRWQRCVRAVDGNLGQALGQEYVEKAFSPEAKSHALELINNLVAALRSDIPTLSWMGDETKKNAIAKLDAFGRKIAYPDKWLDYSKLEIDRGPYVTNLARASEFELRRDLAKIGKPVDRTEWRFTTPTVNASYNPSKNEITFPAGILQPPFYDVNADDAYNYGGIGVVIGHEMTHGFDDSGAQFDKEGNLKNWWSEQDLKNFKSRAECVSKQYDTFEIEPAVNVNGKLVNGEAIADLGGATIALAAYEKSLEGKERKVIDGFTPEQRFFLGFAQVWAQNIRPEEARLRIKTDPHPPAQFRVNGTVANMPEFKKAFGCVDDAKMARTADTRCQIW